MGAGKSPMGKGGGGTPSNLNEKVNEIVKAATLGGKALHSLRGREVEYVNADGEKRIMSVTALTRNTPGAGVTTDYIVAVTTADRARNISLGVAPDLPSVRKFFKGHANDR